MASFEDVSAPKGQWLNLSNAVGTSAGIALSIQSKSGHNVLIEERDLEPPSPDYGLKRSTNEFTATSPEPTEFIWVYALDANAVLNVQVSS